MKIFYNDLFPVSILNVKEFLSKKECEVILQYILNDVGGFKKHSAFPPDGNSLSTHESDFNILDYIIKLDGCNSIIIRLMNCLSEYESRSGLKIKNLNNSWVNIQKPNDFLSTHTHPNSNVSGTLYINVDDDSSPLCVHTVNPYIQYSQKSSLTPMTYEWCSFKPEIGELIIFPSWLPHGSNGQKNQTENRVVISFNA